MSDAKQNTIDLLRQEIALLNALLTQAESHRDEVDLLLRKAQSRIAIIKAAKKDAQNKYNHLTNS